MFKRKVTEHSVMPDKEGSLLVAKVERRFAAFADPNIEIFPEPVGELNRLRAAAGYAAYLAAWGVLDESLRKRFGTQPGFHICVNVTGGFRLNIEPSRDGRDHIQYNGGSLHPLAA